MTLESNEHASTKEIIDDVEAVWFRLVAVKPLWLEHLWTPRNLIEKMGSSSH